MTMLEEWAEVTQGYGKRLRNFEPHYEGSPVVAGPPGAVISAHGEHTFTARAGHHLPPRALASGRNAFAELGPWFTLLALDAPDGSTDGLEAAAKDLGVPLTVVRDGAGPAAGYGARPVLGRPDPVVVWAGDTGPPGPAALLRTVTHRG